MPGSAARALVRPAEAGGLRARRRPAKVLRGGIDLPNPVARDFLMLMFFTGLRRREAASLRWDDVDFAGNVIRLPAARAKSGRKFDVPMSTIVKDLLVARRAIGDMEFVFPADSESGHIEEPKMPLQLVKNACGVAVSAHDLRRTYLSVAERCVSGIALKALANHSIGDRDVTQGYIQLSPIELAEAAEVVAERIAELCQIPQLAART